MILDQSGNVSIVTQEKSTVAELVKNIEDSYAKIKNDNIIVVLTSLKPLGVNDIAEFLQISNTHRASKKSFVVVSDKINIDLVPDEIIVVPTLQEAHDIIEMEEMERDLGI